MHVNRDAIYVAASRDWRDRKIKSFDGYIVVAAPFGGPVALIPDRLNVEKRLRIFNCNGTAELGSLEWKFEELSSVVGYGWGSDEMLYVVHENGHVLRISPCAVVRSKIDIFDTSRINGGRRVLKLAWWPSRDGFVVLTDEVRLWALDIRRANVGYSSAETFLAKSMLPRPISHTLRDIDSSRPPTAISVMESARRHGSTTLDILFATWDDRTADSTRKQAASLGFMSGLSSKGLTDEEISDADGQTVRTTFVSFSSTLATSPISHLSVHPNGQWIAAVTLSGTVTILSSDFREKILELVATDAPGSTMTPKYAYSRRGSLSNTRGNDEGGASYVCWSGLLFRGRSPALAVSWRRSAGDVAMLLVDLEGNCRWEMLPPYTVLVSEVDGVRAVSPQSVEMFHLRNTSDNAAALVDALLDSRAGREQQQQRTSPKGSVEKEDKDASPSTSPTKLTLISALSARFWGKSAEMPQMSERVSIVERSIIECLRISMSHFSRPQQEIYVEAASHGKQWLDRQMRESGAETGLESASPPSDEKGVVLETSSPPSQPSYRDEVGRRKFLDRVGVCCRQLRLLNALRAPNIGVPLTLPQLQFLSERVLLARLARRRLYELAMRISKHLPRPLDKDAILLMWASDLMMSAAKRRHYASSTSTSNVSAPSKPKRRDTDSSTSSGTSSVSNRRSSSAASSSYDAADEMLHARMRGNFERHGFRSYGSAAAIAGKCGLRRLCRMLLRHESSQRVRVATYLSLDTPATRLTALREASAMPFGYLDSELLVSTLIRIQDVVYPEISDSVDDMFTTQRKKLEKAQEMSMHGLVLAKDMPPDVAETYVRILRDRKGRENQRHRLLMRARRYDEAVRMYIAQGCRFYLKPRRSYDSTRFDDDDEKRERSSSGASVQSWWTRALRRERNLNACRRAYYHEDVVTLRPSRRGRVRTPPSARLETEARFRFLDSGQKLCKKYKFAANVSEHRKSTLVKYEAAMHQQQELLKIQVKYTPGIIGGSVVDTLLRLMGRTGEGETGAMKLAESFREKFNITPKRFERIRVRAYARASKWNELDSLISSIGADNIEGGMAGVVDACMEAGTKASCEAAQFAHRIVDKRTRFEKFIQLEKWDAASLLAIQLGTDDVRTLLLQANLPSDLRDQLTLDEDDNGSGASDARERSGEYAFSSSHRNASSDSLPDVVVPRFGGSTGTRHRPRSSVFSAPFRLSDGDYSGSSSVGFFEKVRRSMPRLG